MLLEFTMAGKWRELVDTMLRRKIDIPCVQETRCAGKSIIELGEVLKLFYCGEQRMKNGVEDIMKEEWK